MINQQHPVVGVYFFGVNLLGMKTDSHPTAVVHKQTGSLKAKHMGENVWR